MANEWREARRLFLNGSEDEGDLDGDEESVEERKNDENLSGSLSGECEKSI